MKRLLLSGLFVLGAGPLARAVDMSGTYENLGSVVASPQEAAGSSASLRGLVGLEFNLPVARLLYSGPARFEFRQTSDNFYMRCIESDGTESWNGRWPRGPGYDVEEKQVKLVFRSPQRLGDDGFLFLLSPAGDQKLLVVEVYYVKSTSFGPGMKPVGTFVFGRLPDIRTASR